MSVARCFPLYEQNKMSSCGTSKKGTISQLKRGDPVYTSEYNCFTMTRKKWVLSHGPDRVSDSLSVSEEKCFTCHKYSKCSHLQELSKVLRQYELSECFHWHEQNIVLSYSTSKPSTLFGEVLPLTPAEKKWSSIARVKCMLLLESANILKTMLI